MALNNGDFAEFWSAWSNLGVPSAVEEQVFTSTGAKVGDASIVDTIADAGEGGGRLSATTLPNGDVVLVYLDGGPQVPDGVEGSLNENVIQGQVFSPDGAPITGDGFSINTSWATQVSVTGLANGNFAVGWITESEIGGTTQVATQIFTLGNITSQTENLDDFNGDGYADIPWRNTNGDTELWNPNGSGGFTYENLGVVNTSLADRRDRRLQRRPVSSIFGATPMATRSCGIPTARAVSPMRIWASSTRVGRSPGQATSTGLAKGILWRNSNGDTELWNPNGSGGFASEDLGVVNTSWQIAGTGDFNGSGEDSILWRNTNGDTELWNPNGSGGFTGQNLGVVNTSWQIAGTGDFTGTGQDSILWRNTNGDTELWNPNGSGGFTYQNLGVVNTSWQIAGTGDFTGTGERQHSVAQHQRRHGAVESQRLGRFHLSKSGRRRHQLVCAQNFRLSWGKQDRLIRFTGSYQRAACRRCAAQPYVAYARRSAQARSRTFLEGSTLGRARPVTALAAIGRAPTLPARTLALADGLGRAIDAGYATAIGKALTDMGRERPCAGTLCETGVGEACSGHDDTSRHLL